MAEKRVIEQPASEEVYNDDWFLKDSPTQETSKINLANLKAAILDGKNVAALSDDIAPEYNPNESYVAGDLAIHNSLLYICLGATTGNWDSTKWDLTSIAELLANLDLSADNISYDNTTSGLEAENVQDAIDEVLETAGKVDDIVSHGQSLVENKISDLSSLSAVGTASGDIASFSDGSDLPMPSLKIAIEPQQDLHGYDSPWVGGAGKNLIPLTVDNLKNINTDWSGDSTTKGGVTFTILKDAVGNVTGIKANGTAAQTAQLYLAKNFHIGGTTYTLSGFDSSLPQNSESYIRVYAPGNTLTVNHDTSSNYKDLETLDNYTIWISIASGTVVNNAIFYPQLEKGSTATSYAPYSNICPISGWDECNVSVSGVNVWDEEWENGYWNVTTGQPVANNDYIRCKNFIPIKPNSTYKLVNSNTTSLKNEVLFFDKNNGLLSYGDCMGNSNFTTPSNCYFIKFYMNINYGATYNHDISINYPSTDTSYHAYNGHTYTIDLGSTRYGGTLDVVNGVLKVIYGIKVYSGNSSEGWYADGTQSGSTYRMKASDVPSNIKLPSSNADAMSAISNQFIAISADNIFLGNEGIGIPTNGSYLTLYSSVYNTNDVSLWKTHLASNPMQVVYELATPQAIQLTPTQVKSLLGANNVWADTGDIQKAEYVRDATTIINEILSRLNA